MQENIEFGPMTEADIDAVLEIEQQSFHQPWGYISFSGELSNPNSYNYVGRASVCCHSHRQEEVKNNHIISYISFHLILDEMHLLKIVVDLEWRRYGIGFQMLDKYLNLALKKGVTTSFLEVRESNQAAINFYHQFGFQVIGKRKRYYSETGEDALVLMKEL